MSDPTINGGNLPQVNVTAPNRQRIRQELLQGIEFAKKAGADYSKLQEKLNQFDAELAAELEAEKNTDTAKFTNQPATEADKDTQAARAETNQKHIEEIQNMKDEALKRRTKVDPKFQEKCAELDAARADYESLLAEYQTTNQQVNGAYKKSVTLSKKAKETKKATREAASKNLETVKKSLAQARDRMIAAEKAFGDDKSLKAANEYLLRQAEKEEANLAPKDRKMTQRAARYQADTYYDKTEEGRKAKLENARKAARGKADHALSKKERKDRARETYAKEIGGTSIRYASLDQKRQEKNYKQIAKEQALQKIVVGDKDKYKANKKDDANGNPTVTYMSEKTYNAAREYAASKGITLPEYKKGLELTDQQMRDYQQVMMDAASDFGDRADISERKRISDDFKDISFTTTKAMFEAANIDVQLRHNTAAAVASTIAGIVTGGKLTEVVGKIADQLIPGAGKAVWVPDASGQTGHYEFQDLLVKGSDGKTKFKVGNAMKHIGAGLAAGALVKAVDHEIGLLKKGKNLEDVVYNTLDQDVPAFKNATPNAKKKMAKFIASPKMTSEQKLALLEKAMGTGKLNPRELAGAIAQLGNYDPKEDAPTVENVDKDDMTIYAQENGKWVDENGEPVDLKGTKLVDEFGKPINLDSEYIGTSGTAVAENISKKTKGLLTESKAVVFGNNPNDKNALSQIIITNPGAARNVVGKPKDPDSYDLPDNSNDQENLYHFRKLTPQEVTENGLDPKKTWHVLESAEGPNKDKIGQNIGKIYEWHRTEGKEGTKTAHIVDEKTNEIIKDVTINTHNLEYRLDAVQPTKKLKNAKAVGSGSAADYSKTGAHPKRKV